jgi:hypothetical protein
VVLATVLAGMSEAVELRADVEHLAGVIGPRHPGLPAALHAAADYIGTRLAGVGLSPRDERFSVDGVTMVNVVADLRGPEPGVIVVGAHYDSVPDVADAPGADDNASGVAVLLALAARMVTRPLHCTIRFVAFANEEGMRWGSQRGGSWHHVVTARQAGDELRTALILDSLGCYDARPGSQAWPAWWMPWVHGRRGDFLCVQAAWRDRRLARRCAAAGRGHGLPIRGCWWPGQDWQLMGDQESFHRHAVPVIALTDTDRLRNPRFHRPGDQAASLDYDGLERAVAVAAAVLDQLVRESGLG